MPHGIRKIYRFIAVCLAAVIVLCVIPLNPVFAAIDDPQASNIEKIYNNGQGLPAGFLISRDKEELRKDLIAFPKTAQDYKDLKTAGIWTVYLDGKAVGSSLPIKYLWTEGGYNTVIRRADFRNFIAASKASEWRSKIIDRTKIKIEDGDYQTALSNALKASVRLQASGNGISINEDRIYIRTLAEVYGAYVDTYVDDKYNYGKTGKIYMYTYPTPTGTITPPAADATQNGMPVYYIEDGKTTRDLQIIIKGQTFAQYSEGTRRVIGEIKTQFIKMTFDVDGKRIINGNTADTNQNTIKVPITLSEGTHRLRLFIKDIIGRWEETNLYIVVAKKPQNNNMPSPSSQTQGGLKALFDISISGSGYFNNGTGAKGMTGDTITLIDKSTDTSGMYTNVYDREVRSSYIVAVSPAPSTRINYVYHDQQYRSNWENAKMNTPKWYVPRIYGYSAPYAQAKSISITAQKTTQPYSAQSYYYNMTPYRYEDRGWYITRTASDWDRDILYYKTVRVIVGYDEEGNPIYATEKVPVYGPWYKVYWDVNFWNSKTVWAKYDNSQVIGYGLISPGQYVTKKYADDKYQMESFPDYTMWVGMSVTDYYTKTPTPNIETNFSYYYAPIKIYHNNKPVAYFSIAGSVMTNDGKISIIDQSYDPDMDKIVKEVWEISGNGIYATFSNEGAVENYINTVLAKKPGTYKLTLTVLDDPVQRYNRLTSRWSEAFARNIVILPNDSPSYLSYKAEIEFDRDYVYTQYIKNAELNVTVKVTDIGYWTWDVVNGQYQERFIPVKLTQVQQPYHDIVRYTANRDVMRINPISFNITSQGYNSFSYTAKFIYPKAGRPESTIVFPFTVEYFGYIDSLKAQVPVNAFNITFFNDSTKPDKTVFYKIPQRQIKIDSQIKPPKP